MKRALAYLVCAIPAAIGVWFVAHYAYTTSDTAIDAYSNAFVFAMIAGGAYLCPALAIAIGRRNRIAAAFFWLVAVLAIATNWSNTLGAITNRGAGLEAERAKAAKDLKNGERRLAQVDAELARLPVLAVTPEAVSAADAAVKAAERARAAECDKRGPFCRQRETDEQSKRDALAALTADKAKSDLRERLSTEAAAIRKRLANAPAVKEPNTLGTALGRLLPWVDADTASTAQQGLMSLIVELLIAAFLALPELLSSPHRTPVRVATRQEKGPQQERVERVAEPLALPKPRLVSEQLPALSVAEYAAERLQPSLEGSLSVDELYADYQNTAKRRSAPALGADQFAASFVKLCEGTAIAPVELAGVVYLSNVQFANGKNKSRRLGNMARKS